MPNLGLDIRHHDVFERFCIFGDIKQVCVRQLSDEKNYATILFRSESSMKLALVSNPHELRGKSYSCFKIGIWRLGLTNMFTHINTFPATTARHPTAPLPYGVNLRYYQYQSVLQTTSQDNTLNKKADLAENKNRSALLPASSIALLSTWRKSQATKPPIDLQSKVKSDNYRYSLMSSMGRNFKFVRHSYTDFLSYLWRPGHYQIVPINSCIRMTALDYAAQRDSINLTASHYVKGSVLKNNK